MDLQKQSWEARAEAGRVLEHSMLDLMRKGVLEWNVLMWLAEARKTNTAVDQLLATVLEDAANGLNKIAKEAHDAGVVPDNPPQYDVTDDDRQREMDATLPPLLGAGADEAVVVRWLALFRKDASLDDKREEKMRAVDVQYARVLWEASERLEDVWANPDEEEAEPESYEIPQKIVLTPGAMILNDNPKLFEGCTDFVGLMNKLNRTGRNEPCPCNSGKKFKRCHGRPL